MKERFHRLIAGNGVAVSDAADRAESLTLGDDGTKTALSSPRRQEG